MAVLVFSSKQIYSCQKVLDKLLEIKLTYLSIHNTVGIHSSNVYLLTTLLIMAYMSSAQQQMDYSLVSLPAHPLSILMRINMLFRLEGLNQMLQCQ